MFRHISEEFFLQRYRSTFDRIFVDPAVNPRSFRNGGWKTWLLPYGFHLRETDFLGFQEAARMFDQIVVATDTETIPAHGHSVMFDLSSDEWERARCDDVLGHVDVAVFGASGSWGMLISTEDYAVVGGEARFSDTFLRAVGGECAARDTFIEFCDAEWAASAEFRQRILKDVGWFP
jgi:hypothetical protein